MGRFHATLISEKLVDTVNFYEDYFGFLPIVEKDGYVLLQKQDDPDLCVALFDSNHRCVKDMATSVQGLVLNFSVPNVKDIYENLYMEGLEMFKEYGTDIHGKNHFVVYDPNGVLVNVCEPMDMRELIVA